jgi:hypothetical protein
MKRIGIFTLMIFAIALLSIKAEEVKKSLEDYIVDKRIDKNGNVIIGIQVPGRPPEGYKPKPIQDNAQSYSKSKSKDDKLMTIFILPSVPAFDWSYGCSATSGAMMAGYYDNQNYLNMYTGPANSGVVPMNNSTWGEEECPLSATHNGYDGRTIRGHVDDYWRSYGNNQSDPYIGNWTQHTWGDCTGDYMGTNQSAFSNPDGATRFYYYGDGSRLYDHDASPYKDGCYGLRRFFESRNYEISSNYNQLIYGINGNTQGFTFSDFCDQIDQGYPVLIHIEGHTMLGYGYNTETNQIYIKNTWDYNSHTMTWGGTYYDMRHYMVSVFEFECPIERDIPTTTVAIGSSQDFSASTNVYVASDSKTLTVSGNGSSGGSVSIRASQGINLYPGFKVNHGGTFSARIVADPCSTSISPRIRDEERLPENKISYFDDDQLVISPNPNYGVFSLKLSRAIPEGFSLEIFNSLGEIVLSDDYGNVDDIRINLSDSPNGIYFIKISAQNYVITEKFIKL